MIQSKEISIIMQGVANNDTDKVLLNLRSFFPDAEIIFSTWKGNTYHNDKINTIVESEDPGAYPLLDNPLILNSQNREIVGIYNGLLKAKRKYSLKVRTDMYFENINFLSYMHKFPKRCSQYKFLKERILCSTSFTINPHRDPKPFHLSDWFYFGLTEDLLKVFSSPLAPEPETSRYFETHFRPKDKYDAWFPVYTRYPAEQYIWLAFVKRFSDIHCKDCFDISNNNIEKCEIIFANNTVLLDAANIRYSSYKYKKMHKHNDLSRMYSHREWLKLYKKYCDSSVHIPLVDMEKIRRCFRAILKNKKYRLQNNLKYNFMSLLGISFSDPFNQKEKNKIRPFIKERIMLKYIKYKILYIFSHSEKDKWKYKEAKTWLKTQKNLKKCISPETFFVIGDSHTDVFNQNMLYKKIRLAEWKLKSNLWACTHSAPDFITYHLDACTAYNMDHYGSSMKGREKVDYLINTGLLPKGGKIVTSFGEIDCRVHIKRQAEKQHYSIEKVIDDVLNHYGTFLKYLKSKGFQVIAYAPIASQKDNVPVDPLFPRYGSEQERNEISLLFNQKLQKLCKENHIGFVSIISKLLDDSLLTKGEYYRDGVHLNTQLYPMLVEIFKGLK